MFNKLLQIHPIFNEVSIHFLVKQHYLENVLLLLMSKPMMHHWVSSKKILCSIFNQKFILACPILKGEEPTVLPFPAPGDSPPLDAMAYNLHNNVWDTNYIYWFPFVKGDESWRARFLVTFDGSCN
jgi:hypothetical protein